MLGETLPVVTSMWFICRARKMTLCAVGCVTAPLTCQLLLGVVEATIPCENGYGSLTDPDSVKLVSLPFSPMVCTYVSPPTR